MNNFLKPFKSPFFKKTIGTLLISYIILILFRFVKVVPPVEKFGLLIIAFLAIYLIISTLFKNK
jgi:hypothetical protein